ncbi:MAG TPA: C2H2-type zinc finger protein [Nitrososphaeraceae archaeon]|nr:C2H2-type zinc finger protein [Nitrososphaeraceae archaeon]
MQSEPYRCDICGMAFVNSDELVKHKTVHINEMYQCQSCNRFFANKQEFEKHTIEVHG